MNIEKGSKPKVERATFGSTVNINTVKEEAFGYNYDDKLKEIKYLDKKFKIANYGISNNQDVLLEDLAKNSSWHKACINTRAQYIQGDGLMLTDAQGNEVRLPIPNFLGEGWNDVFEKIALDYITYGGYAVEVYWSADFSRIAEVRHSPFKSLRAEQMDAFGIIPAYFKSKNWSNNSTSFYYQESNSNKVRVPVFNPSKREEEPHQILVVTRPKMNSDYYPEPDYIGAIDAILLDKAIIDAQGAYARNAPLLSSIINVALDLDPASQAEMISDALYDVEMELAGAANAGKPAMFVTKGDGSGSVTIADAPKNENQNSYDDWQEYVRERILSSHTVLFPEVVGVQAQAGFLGTQDIEQKFQIFFNTSLKRPRNKIINGLNRLSEYLVAGTEFSIKPLRVTEGLDDEGQDGDISGDNEVTQ